ncbi:MAG: AtpZ/AtpI family protein [Bacteroidota bacterium]
MSDSKNKYLDVPEEVGQKEQRKMKARREKKKDLWYGLGMFGLVGWSVSIPTLLFLALGIWIDTHYQASYSWTLMLLVVGIAAGCFNAWYWVSKESRHTNQH